MSSNGMTKSPLEYLRDIVEYRDDKSPDDENIKLIRENIELLKDYVTNCNLTIVDQERTIVILLGLLYHPFLSLNLRPYKKFESSSDAGCMEKNNIGDYETDTNVNLSSVYSIIQMIGNLQQNLFTLIDSIRGLMKTQERMFLEMDLSYKNLLLSCSIISYVGYGLEKTVPHNVHFFPNVLSSQYILIRHLPMLHLLLSQQHQHVYYKGLILGSKLLKRIEPGTLDANLIELIADSPIDDSLVKIMKYSTYKDHRAIASSLFQLFVNCFKLSTRCQLLLQILFNPEHEKGVQRLILSIYKDLFVKEKDWTPLIGRNLNQVILRSLVLSLPDGVDSDLAENYDSICTLLNFIRYLLIRDQVDSNESKIWSMIDLLKKDCIDLIWQAIQVSKARYNARLQELESPESKNLGKKEEDNCFKLEILNDDNNYDNTSKTNMEIPNITKDQEKESLACGLTNLEMIELLVGRINDIIDEANRSGGRNIRRT